ncbi:MAG TPA: universal stress protein [Gemmatimonadales bacterium]|nr:universal stress protein [Gemmatimonadales bacterium]
MLATILVPLDGSRFAETALPVATRLTARAEGRLYLAMAHRPLAALVGLGEVAAPSFGADDDARVREEEYLTETSVGLGSVGTGPVRFRLRDGFAGETICDEAGRVGTDLIIMATHGRGAMGRIWLGSVADHVVRHSTRPVLLVHPGRDHAVPPEQFARNILVALDQSTYSEAIIDPVLDIARLTGAEVTLLTIVAPVFDPVESTLPHPVPQHPAIQARRSDEAHCRLRRAASRLRERGVRVSMRVVVGSSPAAGILDVLEEERFDMVALTTHGAGGVRRLMVGSVADKVIRGAHKPVLVLRPAVM